MFEETQLAHELQQGSHLSFASIYRLYAQKAYMLSFKYLGSKELAEDAVQNVFLQLWRIHEDIDDRQPISHLLFKMLKNHLLNVLRDSKSNLFIIDQCLDNLNFTDGVEEDDISQEQLYILKRAIEQLSPQRRKIFIMKISGKYSNIEIAEKLHLSVNTIKFQYSQSLKQVKELSRSIAIALLMAATSLQQLF